MVHIHLIRADETRRTVTADMGGETDYTVKPERRNRTDDLFIFLSDFQLKGAVIADLNADSAYL